MHEFKPSRNLCLVASIVLPMTAEQHEWMRLGGDDAGKVFVDATGIDLTDPDHKLYQIKQISQIEFNYLLNLLCTRGRSTSIGQQWTEISAVQRWRRLLLYLPNMHEG